jgi:hypothetical protein
MDEGTSCDVVSIGRLTAHSVRVKAQKKRTGVMKEITRSWFYKKHTWQSKEPGSLALPVMC